LEGCQKIKWNTSCEREFVFETEVGRIFQ